MLTDTIFSDADSLNLLGDAVMDWNNDPLSHHHSTLRHRRDHLPADADHHLQYNGDSMNIIKTIWKHIEEKPLWAL